MTKTLPNFVANFSGASVSSSGGGGNLACLCVFAAAVAALNRAKSLRIAI
jgi:hypothetical protein